MNQKPDKLVPSLIGGAIIAGISAIPGLNFINCFCCAGIVIGGYFAVFFYVRNLPDDYPLTYSDGALLGILAGVFGAVLSTLLTLIIGFNIDQMMDQISQYMGKVPSDMENIMELLKENSNLFLMATLAMGLVTDILFGLLGGIIGISILGKKRIQTK
ncbi:hypothetical protein JW960_24015 [candidate division KSB1 bacterium]|nr:hypothetical protein [candidate division KSB1 bacterium]